MSNAVNINEQSDNSLIINNLNRSVSITQGDFSNPEIKVVEPVSYIVATSEGTNSITVTQFTLSGSQPQSSVDVNVTNVDTLVTITSDPTPVITLNSPGPSGPSGPAGPPGTIDGVDISAFVLTSSYNPFTASYYLDSASFDIRINAIGSPIDLSEYTLTSSFNSFTSSYYLDSASFDTRINNIDVDTSFLVTTSSFNSFTGSYNTGSFTGSFTGQLIGTASWAQSASRAVTASFAISSSRAVTASFALVASTAGSANTAGFASVAGSADQVRVTGFVQPDTVTFVDQIDYDILPDNSVRLLTVTDVEEDAQYKTPIENDNVIYSQVDNGLFILGEKPKIVIGQPGQSDGHLRVFGKITALGIGTFINSLTFLTNIEREDSGVATLSFNTGSGNLIVSGGGFSGSFTGNLIGTASWANNYNETDPIFTAMSGSFVTTSSFNSFTGSIQNQVTSLTNATSSYVLNAQTSSFVTTSSFNSFTSSYNTGSFTGSFTGQFNGTATSASYALTASYALNAGGISTLIDSIGARVYTDDTFITAGSKGYKHIPYNANIIKTRTIANTNGYIDINIKRNGTTLGTISLSNQSSSLDTTLSGWTTLLNEDDLIEFYVSQSSTYITDISIFIDIQST